MPTVIGYLTADAKVLEVNGGRSVVNFTIAQNDYFRDKSTGQMKEVTTYFWCTYWMQPKVAAFLKKGSLLEVAGRIGAKTQKRPDGNIVPVLTIHVQHIQVHGKLPGHAVAKTPDVVNTTSEEDNLTF